MPYYNKDPKRDHNFDNHHIVIMFSMYVEGSGLRALVFSSGRSQVSCWFNPSSVSVLDVGVWLSGDLITNRISDKFEEL